MDMSGSVIVISDNSNSSMIKLLKENKVDYIIKRSVLGVIALQSNNIKAIIIDKPDQNFDMREFLLTADFYTTKKRIYIPEYYHKHEDWSIIKSPHNFYIFKTYKALLKQVSFNKAN